MILWERVDYKLDACMRVYARGESPDDELISRIGK